MNWDDLRFVVALAEQGSLSKAARVLGVDHTTVGRRVASAEAALGVSLFTRSTAGVALSVDGARLLPMFRRVGEAVHAVACEAQSAGAVRGLLRVTAPETIGMWWLSGRLAAFTQAHPGLQVALDATGSVADLGRSRNCAADSAVGRRSVAGAAGCGHRLWLVRKPVLPAAMPGAFGPAGTPVSHLAHRDEHRGTVAHATRSQRLVSDLSIALWVAAKAGAGLAVLPRFLGDSDAAVVHLPMPDESHETLWLTVHEDARAVPRVRAAIDFLLAAFDEARVPLRQRWLHRARLRGCS